jgi:hypothetical protein
MGDRFVEQVLIKWTGWPRSMATWENLITLQQRFPAVAAWGKRHHKTGGMLPLLHQMGQG